MIDCFQYTRELTRHCILASPHFTSSHFTSLPPCISPASNGLCTCIIASHCDAKTTCNRISSRTIASTSNLVATHSLSLPSTQPTHFHPPPISTQISLTTTAKASLHYHPLSSLDSTPLSRTADGYQPLQLPPHCTHLDRLGCTRLLLLRPALHASIRCKEGPRGRRAPSLACELSHRTFTLSITLHITLCNPRLAHSTHHSLESLTRAPLYSTSLPIWVFEPSTQSWQPSTSDSSASRSSPVTAKTTHSTTPNHLARAASCARLDRVNQDGATQRVT